MSVRGQLLQDAYARLVAGVDIDPEDITDAAYDKLFDDEEVKKLLMEYDAPTLACLVQLLKPLD